MTNEPKAFHDYPKHVIERYCTCGFVIADNDVDGESITPTWINPDCKLHSLNPKYDLPKGVL